MTTHGFDQGDWEAAKRQVKKILVAKAKAGGVMFYSELVDAIDVIDLEAYDARLSALLAEVSTEEATAGRGILSVIVVSKDGNGRPGRGFYELAERLGRDTFYKEDCWLDEAKKVRDYWRGTGS